MRLRAIRVHGSMLCLLCESRVPEAFVFRKDLGEAEKNRFSTIVLQAVICIKCASWLSDSVEAMLANPSMRNVAGDTDPVG